jgi:phenylacetate-CoA ligase
MSLPRKLVEFHELKRCLWLDGDALRELRERKLRSLVRHAYRNVPHYRHRLDQAGLDPASVRTLEDLERIPVTTREDLRRAGREGFLARGTDPAACVRYLTSGTTGKSLVVLASRSEARARLLLELRGLWATGLFRPRDRLVILGPVGWGPLHLYQRLGLFRRDYLSPWLPVEAQIARLQRLRPTVLWVYPSMLSALLHHLEGRLSRVIRPRALVTSAEGITDELATAVRTDLDLEWFNFYGAMETGRIAWECRAHDGLHLNADRLVLELLPHGATGMRTVITALDFRTMPILRYDLGDATAPVEGACPCGISLPRIQPPRGRISGLVRLPDGRAIASWSLRSILRELPGVDQYRLVQESPAHLVAHLVVDDAAPDLEIEMERRLRPLVGPAVRIDVVRGTSLPAGTERTDLTWRA